MTGQPTAATTAHSGYLREADTQYAVIDAFSRIWPHAGTPRSGMRSASFWLNSASFRCWGANYEASPPKLLIKHVTSGILEKRRTSIEPACEEFFAGTRTDLSARGAIAPLFWEPSHGTSPDPAAAVSLVQLSLDSTRPA